MPTIELGGDKSALFGGSGSNFCIENRDFYGNIGYVMQFDRSQAAALWIALGDFLSEAGKGKIALLMGGPKHGELIQLGPGASTIDVVGTTNVPFTNFDGDDEHLTYYETHKYTKRSDYVLNDAGKPIWLPFDIFEHSSLCDENVERKAARLDAARTAAFRAEKATAKKADQKAIEAAKAHDEYATARAEARRISEERQQLEFEFGV
jgi:hypothetical protein